MTLLLLFNEIGTAATVVAPPSAQATASAAPPTVARTIAPPSATATAAGVVPTIAIRTTSPAAVTALAMAIGTITEPPRLVIALRVSAPVAGASAMAPAPVVTGSAAPIILTMPSAQATALAIPPTQVGTGGATVVSAPVASASALGIIPIVSVGVLMPGAFGLGIATAPTVKISMVVASAQATASAIEPIIMVLGVPAGVITGRILVIDRITGALAVRDRIDARLEILG